MHFQIRLHYISIGSWLNQQWLESNCCARAPPISLIRCQRPRKCPAPSCEPVFHDCQLCPKENRHQIVPPKKAIQNQISGKYPQGFSQSKPPVQSAMSSLTGLTLPRNPGSGIPEVWNCQWHRRRSGSLPIKHDDSARKGGIIWIWLNMNLYIIKCWIKTWILVEKRVAESAWWTLENQRFCSFVTSYVALEPLRREVLLAGYDLLDLCINGPKEDWKK